MVEVRIPTYKRPKFLKRAIENLFYQTYKDWAAIVMDDSPEMEAGDLVDSFGDERIIYSPNRIKLGRCGNLDRAFQSSDYIGGSYAFVLEDDNYLFPDFISENIKSLKANNVPIVLRNQEMRIEKNGKSIPMQRTTRGNWFRNKIYDPIEIYPHLFFHTGISNGGLFWDTKKIKSNLQIGFEVDYPSFQEIFRCLQIIDPIYFEPEPLCVFTFFEERDDIAKMSERENRLFNRAQQSIYMYLLKKYGSLLVERATELANQNGTRYELERHLIDAFHVSYDFQCIRGLEFMRTLSKSFLRYILYKNPIERQYGKEYYR